jgi:hypothetical protein
MRLPPQRFGYAKSRSLLDPDTACGPRLPTVRQCQTPYGNADRRDHRPGTLSYPPNAASEPRRTPRSRPPAATTTGQLDRISRNAACDHPCVAAHQGAGLWRPLADGRTQKPAPTGCRRARSGRAFVWMLPVGCRRSRAGARSSLAAAVPSCAPASRPALTVSTSCLGTVGRPGLAEGDGPTSSGRLATSCQRCPSRPGATQARRSGARQEGSRPVGGGHD